MFKRQHQAVSISESSLLSDLLGSLRIVFILSLIVFAGIWGYKKMSDPTTLPITKVRALGDFSYVTEKMLHTALASSVESTKGEKILSVFEDKGFFSIDVDVIKQRVEKMAWVKQASVQRVWPDTLVIEVVEHKAVAYWNNEGLVSDKGVIFQPNKKSYPENLTRFIFPKQLDDNLVKTMTVKCLGYYKDATDMFASLDFKVKAIEFDARQALTFILNNGVELNLGRQNKLFRMQRFAQIYSTLQNRMNLIEHIDMRYTNGFSVKWKHRQAYTNRHLNINKFKEKSGSKNV